MWRLYLPKDFSFYDLLKPGLKDFDKLHWFIDIQTGPFKSCRLFEHEENEDLYEHYVLEHEATANTSSHIFRPGFLPVLGTHITVDECSYYFGFDPPRAGALDDIVAEINSPAFDEWPEAFRSLLRLEKSIFLFADYSSNWDVSSGYEPYKDYFLSFPAAALPGD